MMNSLDDCSTTDDLNGLIVLGEAPESDGEEEIPQTRKGEGESNQNPIDGPESPSVATFSKLSQMGHSVSSVVTAVVEKKLSAYIPTVVSVHKDKENESSESKNGQKSTPNSLLQKASSLATEYLPYVTPAQPTESDPPKSLLHEKLFQKNAKISQKFSSWFQDNYNEKMPKVLMEMLHHLGVSTQVELQESVLSMQQTEQNVSYLFSSIDETKLLSDSLKFPTSV